MKSEGNPGYKSDPGQPPAADTEILRSNPQKFTLRIPVSTLELAGI